MKQVMLHIKPAVNEISKKNIIPQSPVSPLTDMDGENVDADDDDTASGSASGSGSGDYTQQVDRGRRFLLYFAFIVEYEFILAKFKPRIN